MTSMDMARTGFVSSMDLTGTQINGFNSEAYLTQPVENMIRPNTMHGFASRKASGAFDIREIIRKEEDKNQDMKPAERPRF